MVPVRTRNMATFQVTGIWGEWQHLWNGNTSCLRDMW